MAAGLFGKIAEKTTILQRLVSTQKEHRNDSIFACKMLVHLVHLNRGSKAFDAVEQRGRFTRILTQAIDYTDRLYELETAEFAYVSRQRFVIRAR